MLARIFLQYGAQAKPAASNGQKSTAAGRHQRRFVERRPCYLFFFFSFFAAFFSFMVFAGFFFSSFFVFMPLLMTRSKA